MKDEALHIHTLQSNLVLKTENIYQRVICEKIRGAVIQSNIR